MEIGGHMKNKNDVEVLIDGTKYTLCGYESTEYILKVASYINSKIDEIKSNMPPGTLLDEKTRNLLMHLNIADDYFKSIEKYEMLNEEKNDIDKVLFELKHELASAKDKIEELKKENAELERRLKKY
ncbi:MAG: cell division protein ZapA [Lachnospiraceae bacterium]|nr:cell division protein ZapA [Lachnospiraceae bacterium]